MANNWAICIGINKYENLQMLRFAVRDAECMKEWFEKDANFRKVYLFTDNSPAIKDTSGSKPFSSQPTYARLKRFLTNRFNSPFLSSGDNLWFFFSGHGLRYEDRDYLMLSDSSGTGDLIKETAISLSYVTERLRRAGADNVIVVQDACRNEGAAKGQGIGFEKHKGVITIYSCSPSERSFEIEERQNGSFTSVLLESLRGQHGNCATVERLNQCLSIQVPELNKKYKKESQTPYLIPEPLCKSKLILLPSMATLEDVKELKLKAYQAEDNNLDLAKILMNQVLIASPADVEALNWFKKIWEKQLVVKHGVELLAKEKSYQTQIEKLEKNHNSQIKELEHSYDKKLEELDKFYKKNFQKKEEKEKLLTDKLTQIKSSYQEDRKKLEQSFYSQIEQLQQQLQTEHSQVLNLTEKLQSTQQELSDKESIIDKLQENIQELESSILNPKTQNIELAVNIELKSSKGIDYTKLSGLLAANKWKEADQETANLMLHVANRVSEQWLRIEDIYNFPDDDLHTIDQLWVQYSKGKFGFSVQKKIYVDELGGTRDYNEKIWNEFCDRVGWRKGSGYLNYSDLTFELLGTTLVGHLPAILVLGIGGIWSGFFGVLLSRKDL